MFVSERPEQHKFPRLDNIPISMAFASLEKCSIASNFVLILFVTSCFEFCMYDTKYDWKGYVVKSFCIISGYFALFFTNKSLFKSLSIFVLPGI